MSYEKDGLLLPHHTEQPQDKETLESFREASLGASATFESLYLPDQDEKAAITAMEIGVSPDMTAQHLNQDYLAAQVASLKALKTQIKEDTQLDPEVRQAYRWRVNESIANVYMLQASAEGNMSAFRRWNEFVYGKPDEAVYRAAIDWVATDAKELLAHESPSVQNAALSVLERLGVGDGSVETLKPNAEIFEAVRQDHNREGGYYALLLAGVEVPEKGRVSRELGDSILRHVIRKNLESEYGIQDTSGATWGLSHGNRAVNQPVDYNMPAKRFQGLALGHEIGSHLLEKINGSRGPVALMEEGLDRYEQGNEGRAILREQVVYDSFDTFGKLMRWQDILTRHIAISYAVGVGDEQPKSAAEVYDMMYVINKMYQARRTPDDVEAIDQKTARKTGKLCARVLKGTDGWGGAYYKDKIYLEGHVAVWREAEENGPQTIENGDLGKFDITNPRHIALLQKQGLLPAESEIS